VTKSDDKDQRGKERIRLALPVRVHCRESLDAEWSEITRLIDLTPFGASFGLSRPTERGRLLLLTMPMPRQLRAFDHTEDQYRVWALVRSTTWRVAASGAPQSFVVGVAFIGKYPPASFLQNPSRRYEPRGEGERLDVGSLRMMGQERSPFAPQVERGTRLDVAAAVVLELLGEGGKAVTREETVTANISRHGATIYTTLSVKPGSFVRLTIPREPTPLFAAVRGRTEVAGGVAHLHLEFIGGEWPLDDLL